MITEPRFMWSWKFYCKSFGNPSFWKMQSQLGVGKSHGNLSFKQCSEEIIRAPIIKVSVNTSKNVVGNA